MLVNMYIVQIFSDKLLSIVCREGQMKTKSIPGKVSSDLGLNNSFSEHYGWNRLFESGAKTSGTFFKKLLQNYQSNLVVYKH